MNYWPSILVTILVVLVVILLLFLFGAIDLHQVN
jgi:preprotein translocase subunit SecE